MAKDLRHAEVLGSSGQHVRQSSLGFTNNDAQVVSPVLSVAAGDEFEVRINQSGLGSVDGLLAGPRAWAAMETVETAFTLSAEPAGALLVFLDGVLQDEDDFSTVTTTLSFTTAPPAGAKVIAYDFGSNNAAVRTPYEVDAFVGGTPSAGQLIKAFVFARDVEFPDDFAGSQLFAETPATAETVFDIEKNGATIGTITVAASGTTGTFATTGSTTESFTAGDRIAILAPDPADATLANIAITLKGTRTS